MLDHDYSNFDMFNFANDYIFSLSK